MTGRHADFLHSVSGHRGPALPGVIETERLLLRPASSGDVEAIARAAEAASTSRMSELIVNSARCWTEHGYGLWVLVPRGEEAVIGWCGLKSGADPGQPELFYGLQPMSRNQGLAAEAARAVVAFALALPAVRSVWAAAATMNLRSAAVMKRAGLVLESAGVLDGVESVIYRTSGGRTGAAAGQGAHPVDRFGSIAEVESFIQEFESCRLPKERWTHQAHLVAGFWYLGRYGMPEALDIVRSRIRKHNESVGTPNTDSNGYHETITRLYLAAIADHAVRHGHLPFERSLATLLASPLARSDWPLKFYSPGRLFSVQARRDWLEPDLQPPK